jgi:hypothetical protein
VDQEGAIDGTENRGRKENQKKGFPGLHIIRAGFRRGILPAIWNCRKAPLIPFHRTRRVNAEIIVPERPLGAGR